MTDYASVKIKIKITHTITRCALVLKWMFLSPYKIIKKIFEREKSFIFFL